jgi:predicted RNase H-related nuclease YkuK (DUF458 family)
MPGTIEEAKKAIAESSPESAVYLGTDSIRFTKKGQKYARYTTIVVLHIDGNHGCRLFENTVVLPDYNSIKQRMLNEVMFTVEHGMEIVDYIGGRPFEIHIDVNKDERHKSNVALKEARGYILGSFGIEPKFKPDAQAATHGADHLVRGH